VVGGADDIDALDEVVAVVAVLTAGGAVVAAVVVALTAAGVVVAVVEDLVGPVVVVVVVDVSGLFLEPLSNTARTVTRAAAMNAAAHHFPWAGGLGSFGASPAAGSSCCCPNSGRIDVTGLSEAAMGATIDAPAPTAGCVVALAEIWGAG
jgi:hypothetical protein